MKIQWENLSKGFAQYNKVFAELITGITDRKYAKAMQVAKKEWDKLIMLHNEFDKLIEPVSPIPIKSPFESPEFINTWKLYKEYLEETHKQYIPSRRELMMLRRLNKLADKNEHRAIEFLEYYICHGSKSIYKPSEKQLTGEEPGKVEEADQSSFDVNAKRVDI
ncbi:hypothetical protein D0T84_14070 [Dysgonomonas sp. 521]|uniref:hypothetical protein n=1 Tax=Dysgonomonas sp. 521 TaxID=2302932 RepID=UPI0013D6962B|nr:hypothetical protein [Dysgonomonas sp. 521]NDV96031.1 hypothetical protein [Dysgonomonas sp. 521]